MRTIRKRINKENLTYYVQKIVEDEDYKKEFIKNCTYLQFDIVVVDSNLDSCELSIELIGDTCRTKQELKEVLDEFIPTLDGVEDFVNNCKYMSCVIARANENIRITYMDNEL